MDKAGQAGRRIHTLLCRAVVFSSVPWLVFAVCYCLVRGWSGLIAAWIFFPFFFYCGGYDSPLLMVVHSAVLGLLTSVLTHKRSRVFAGLAYLTLVGLSVLMWRWLLAGLGVQECMALP
jgi:hypothetical protein